MMRMNLHAAQNELEEEGDPKDRRASKRDTPLVPEASIAGRALMTVIAIMTFLASLTAGAAMLVAGASHDWQKSIAREMTIQVRPLAGHDLETETTKAVDAARAMPGVGDVRVYTKAESEELLQPWLGSGLDLSELPVPRLIVVKLAPGSNLDVNALKQALAEKVSGATLDDHRLWLSRLSAMARTVVFVAIVIFILVLVAMMLAIGFATRGAMAGNREIIEVLHFVGAADSYISRQFQSHFFRLGLRGSSVGGAAAIAMFLAFEGLSAWWRATPGGDQLEAMFGTFGLGFKGYLVIAFIAGGIAVTTGLVSRVIVFRHLRRLN